MVIAIRIIKEPQWEYALLMLLMELAEPGMTAIMKVIRL